jgi:hypothetical protein
MMSPLKTTFHAATVAEFGALNRARYSAAILRAAPESVIDLRTKFNDWHNKHELSFACIRSRESADNLVQGAPYHMPYGIRNHIDDLIRLYFQMTPSHHAQVEIGRKLRSHHTHAFPVITQTVNGKGTRFTTDEGETFADEADLVFMDIGIDHASTDYQNKERMVIAVFDPDFDRRYHY